MKSKFISLTLVLLISSSLYAQEADSTQYQSLLKKMFKILEDSAKKKFNRDYTFEGTRLESEIKPDQKDIIEINAYLDTYYAYYTDTNDVNGFQKFPTVSPRNNSIGLNHALISLKLNSENFRGTTVIHYGDVAQSAWSPVYNLLQEANLGIKIHKKLWFDAGLFRTHFGLESVQPRENITSSMALTTFFEPYFLSGAKLSYYVSDKLMLQANVFNGFNTYIETNDTKAFGLSALYSPSSKITFTFNTITCDESPSGRNHRRLYNDLLFTYKGKKIDIGVELNYGLQQNSQITNPNKTAHMLGGLWTTRYKLNHQWSIYERNEFYIDKNEILTGPLLNAAHGLVGIESYGLTAGIEYKPYPNSFIRIENRYLQMASYDNFFKYNNQYRNNRFEFMINTGIWL